MSIKTLSTYVFAEVANIHKSTFERILRETEIHSGQIFILISLFENDGDSQKGLADKLNLSAPTVYNMVKSLTENGFVECQKCPDDGRSVRVFLTAKAKELSDILTAKWYEFDDSFSASLTDTEKLMLFQLLDKIRIDFAKRAP
jgi:MarR family transcriptional regulator, organic hydroperoxide resistance regulator